VVQVVVVPVCGGAPFLCRCPKVLFGTGVCVVVIIYTGVRGVVEAKAVMEMRVSGGDEWVAGGRVYCRGFGMYICIQQMRDEL